MNKFDKFLEFLFQSKKGRATIAGVAIATSMLFGGCFVTDYLSCFCGKLGCDGCEDFYSGCDQGCYDACDSCHGCALFDYFFNPKGCSKDCGDCGVITCGGCNSSCLTKCGGNCSGGCDDCKVQCGNFTCDKLASSKSKYGLHITFSIVFPNGEHAQMYGSNTYTVSKKDPQGTFIVLYDDNSILGYFDYGDYYYGDTLVISGARIVNAGVLAKAEGNNITLTSRAYEKRSGEMVRINFSYPEEAGEAPNSVPAIIGGQQVIHTIEQPSIPGRRFLGWRVEGTNNQPVQFTAQDTFHLYSLMCSPDATEITLEPVFSQN